MKIIVTGASGRTTRKLIDILIARGVRPSDLILMSRSLERPEVQEYAAMGASVRFGDFTDPATLPQAFAGGDRMFLMPLNHTPDEVDEAATINRAVDEAVKAGVRHIVYQWAASVIVDKATGQPTCNTTQPGDQKVEAHLKTVGIGWTVLRTGGFAESLGMRGRQFLPTSTARAVSTANRIGLVTRDDIAAAGAECLLGEGHEGRVYTVAGPAFSALELKATLEEITGRPFALQTPSDAAYAWDGKSGFYLRDESTPPSDLPLLLGRPGVSALDMLREHAEEFLTGKVSDPRFTNFGFQWQTRGQAERPDDFGLRLNRLYGPARQGDAAALAEFRSILTDNPDKNRVWRQTHPEWFWWETADA